jgi:cell division septation protein DedD
LRPGPTARAAAVLVVFLGLFWGVDRFLGHDGGRQAAGTSRRTAAVAPASTSAPTTTAKPAATHRPATTAAPTTTATTAPPASATTLRPAAGVTVQVLDGAFRNGQGRKVAAMLRAAGYDVLATQSAFGDYPVSRVYYGQGHLDDALALQRRFPAFQVVLPATESGTGLSSKVDLSAVVGKNFP